MTPGTARTRATTDVSITVDCSVADALTGVSMPDLEQLAAWTNAAVGSRRAEAHVDFRVCDEAEMATLNESWRGKQGPTNVLSFPALDEPAPGMPLLGDIALCAPVVSAEAKAQGKREIDHWAHLVIHGVLHLLGFDHIEPADAEAMENLERQLLAGQGIPDPYEIFGYD